MKIKEGNFETIYFSSFKESISLVNRNKLKKAVKHINRIINISKAILRKKPWGKANSNYNKILSYGILFRGLKDFIELRSIVSSNKWIENNKKVEKVWGKICDCKDRLKGFCGNVQDELLNYMLDYIEGVVKEIDNRFGPGLYLSSEVSFRKRVCNICNKDFNTCEHIVGEVHNGILCRPAVEGIEFKGASVVNSPRDLRCRVWPWNVDKQKRTFKGCILTLFSVDDDFICKSQSKFKRFVENIYNSILGKRKGDGSILK